MPFALYYDERHYVEGLSRFISKFFKNKTIPPIYASLFLFSFHHVLLIEGVEFWWRHIDLKVCRRIKERRCLVMSWHFVAFFAMPPDSCPEVFLSTSMVGINKHEGSF